jgi:hypothetical protein
MWETPLSLLPHAHWIEILQLGAAVIGTCANVWGLIDAWKDLKNPLQTQVTLFAAKRNIFEECMRLIIHVLFFINGYVSISFPPPPGLEVTDIPYMQFMVSRVVMSLASGLLTVKSLRDLYDRKMLRELAVDTSNTALLQVVKDKASDIVHIIDQSETRKEQ